MLKSEAPEVGKSLCSFTTLVLEKRTIIGGFCDAVLHGPIKPHLHLFAAMRRILHGLEIARRNFLVQIQSFCDIPVLAFEIP
jgi:hypothetical protein